jgi:hypothetical protein
MLWLMLVLLGTVDVCRVGLLNAGSLMAPTRSQALCANIWLCG